MAKTTQTRNGKGFEYACLKALKAACTELTVKIDERDSPALNSAKNCFESLETQEQSKFCIAAQAPIPFLMDCEPNLNDADDPSLLSIGLQSDSEGQAGDVRDVLLYRVDPKKQTRNWECGISCKHNHDATKHPRINFKPPVKDLFATSWAPSFTMQQEYFDACEEVYGKLFKSTLNNRLHRKLACVIDKSSRGTKLKRAFEELPMSYAKRTLNKGSFGQMSFQKMKSPLAFTSRSTVG